MPVEFSPESIQTLLGLRTSSNPFLCFPTFKGNITGSFSNVTINQIHTYYFNKPRNASKNSFHATGMSADHYVWYRIILDCVLPIVAKGRAMIRIPHLVMMYALEKHLDIDIARHIHSSIIHHTTPSNGKIYIPFGHIITKLLAFQGIDVTVGAVRQLSRQYDQLGPRHLKLARIVYSNGAMTWMNKTPTVNISDSDETKNESDNERLTRIENMVSEVDDKIKACFAEIRVLRQEFRAATERQKDVAAQQQLICDMVHKMSLSFQSPGRPPSPSDDDE